MAQLLRAADEERATGVPEGQERVQWRRSEEGRAMATQVVVRGTVTADGTLELAGPVGLPPGPVEVTVTAAPAPQAESPAKGWWDVLQEIRAEREARGFAFRSKDEIDADIRQMRDEWDEHQVALERLQEEGWNA